MNEKEKVIGYMPALTIEITLSTEGGYLYQVWPRDLSGAYTAEEGEAPDEGNDNGGLCTGNMGDALEMALESAERVVRAHFSDNVWNGNVCPSSLDENGEPSTDGETAHKWSEEPCDSEECTGKKKTCDECGAERDCDGGIMN